MQQQHCLWILNVHTVMVWLPHNGTRGYGHAAKQRRRQQQQQQKCKKTNAPNPPQTPVPLNAFCALAVTHFANSQQQQQCGDTILHKKKKKIMQIKSALHIYLATYICVHVCMYMCVFFSCQLQLQCLYSYATCHPDPLVYCHFLRIEVTRTNRQTLVILAFQKIKQRVTCAYACAMT